MNEPSGLVARLESMGHILNDAPIHPFSQITTTFSIFLKDNEHHFVLKLQEIPHSWWKKVQVSFMYSVRKLKTIRFHRGHTTFCKTNSDLNCARSINGHCMWSFHFNKQTKATQTYSFNYRCYLYMDFI